MPSVTSLTPIATRMPSVPEVGNIMPGFALYAKSYGIRRLMPRTRLTP